MSDIVLGIDLGTTNSVVAVADGAEVRVLVEEGGSRLVPSVVSFHPDGRVLVGVEARDRRLVDAPNTVYSVKRLIGRPFRAPEVAEAQKRFAFKLKESANGGVLVAIRNDTFTLTEISAFVLREVRRVAEQATGQVCAKAVITVPAAFNELQRSATKAAGRVAGLDVLRIVNEPTAAALAYGIGKQRRERVAVYDLGGGTFDLTLLELENDVFEVLGSAGDSFLGGDDVDTILSDAMAQAFLQQHRADPRQNEQAYERLRAAAEWLKCTLSSQEEATATAEELLYGANGRALDLSFTMRRAELEARVQPLVDRSLDVCRKALEEASLRVEDLDSVILVGGSTRIPLVRRRVQEFFGLEPKGDIDPDLVVAQGAAIHGYSIGGRKPEKALARVALKRMTVQEVQAVQQKRSDQRAIGPKQVAFAPDTQREVPKPPPVAKIPARVIAPPPPVVKPAAQAVPVLPKPKLRPSTIPPAPTHAIEAPDFPSSGRLSLDDAFDAPRPMARSAEGPLKLASPAGLLGLDTAFGVGPSLAPESAALDAAVRVASSRPGVTSGSGLLALDDLDDPMGGPAVPVRAAPAVAIAGTKAVGAPPPPPPPKPEVIELDDDALEASFSAAPPPAALFADATIGTLPALHASEPEPELEEPEPPSPAVLRMPAPKAPILMDVTPLSLGVETVGGYCQAVIRRNVPIPCEQTRSFTTASDRQTTVTIRICQGESRQIAENQLLGVIELTGLRPAARGEVKIEVTFEIDASGILDVKAADETTGETQRTRIRLLGGADEAEIAAMQARQQRLVGVAR